MNANIIDWKKLSKTEGYKKLKSEYLRHWKDRYSLYKRVFGYLKKICFKYKLDACKVLDVWERNRTYSFPNYYQDCYMSNLTKLALNTITITTSG